MASAFTGECPIIKNEKAKSWRKLRYERTPCALILCLFNVLTFSPQKCGWSCSVSKTREAWQNPSEGARRWYPDLWGKGVGSAGIWKYFATRAKGYRQNKFQDCVCPFHSCYHSGESLLSMIISFYTQLFSSSTATNGWHYSERNSHCQSTLTLNFLSPNFSLFFLLTSKLTLGLLYFLSLFFFFLLDAAIILIITWWVIWVLWNKVFFCLLESYFSTDIILVMLLTFIELHRNNFP